MKIMRSGSTSSASSALILSDFSPSARCARDSDLLSLASISFLAFDSRCYTRITLEIMMTKRLSSVFTILTFNASSAVSKSRRVLRDSNKTPPSAKRRIFASSFSASSTSCKGKNSFIGRAENFRVSFPPAAHHSVSHFPLAARPPHPKGLADQYRDSRRHFSFFPHWIPAFSRAFRRIPPKFSSATLTFPRLRSFYRAACEPKERLIPFADFFLIFPNLQTHPDAHVGHLLFSSLEGSACLALHNHSLGGSLFSCKRAFLHLTLTGVIRT